MQQKPTLDAVYARFRLARLSWDALPNGWERSETSRFDSARFEEAPKEAKAALKKILGPSDPGAHEIGWGVSLPARDGGTLARAWVLFPRGVSASRARVEIHVNQAAMPASRAELAERFPDISQACQAEEQEEGRLTDGAFLSIARRRLSAQAACSARTLLELIALAGGLRVGAKPLNPEALARVESLLLERGAALPQALPQEPAAPRRPRL